MFRKKEYSPEELLRVKRMALIADIVLIGIILGLVIYVVVEIESVKFLKHDPCQVCMEKTGATCLKVSNNPSSSNYPKIIMPNITEDSSGG